MATQPKRKYSFGLISRLTLIAAFVGLGSWAVFNSRFKDKGDEEVAQNEDDSAGAADEEGTDSDESQGKLLTSLDNQTAGDNQKSSGPLGSGDPQSKKTVPASFVEKQKPAKIKLPKSSDTKKQTQAKSSLSSGFAPVSKNNKKKNTPPPKSSGPPASTFNPVAKSSGDFKSPAKTEPASSGFSPPKSQSFSGSNKSNPPSSTFDPTSSFGSAKKLPAAKKSPAKQDFNPGSSKFNPNSSSLVGSSSDKKKSSPTPDPAKLPSNSKQDPQPSSSGLTNKNSTNPPASSFASNSKSSGPPASTFDPTGGFSGSSSQGSTPKSSGPPASTFNPTGSFGSSTQPARNTASNNKANNKTGFAGGTFGDSSSQANSMAGSQGAGSQGAGGFQSRPSTGTERPLRGGSSSNSQTDPARPNSKFTLGSDLQNKSGSGLGSTKQKPENVFSNRGSAAFQDKGSKPLERKQVPASNGLVKSNTQSSGGSKSTGFGDIGNSGSQNAKANGSNSAGASPSNRNGSPASSRQNGGALTKQKLGPNRSNPSDFYNLQKSGLSSSQASASKQPNSTSGTKFASHPSLSGSPVSGAKDNQPGPTSLEGVQAPAVTIQKMSPREIQVNVETEFKLLVRNVGRATATNITVVDPIPAGTEFVSANPPPAKRGTDGSLIWQFGAIEPNEQQVISIKLLPKRQGEIGSVARMSFQSAATARSICTKPELSLTHKGPQKVLKGRNAQFLVTIKNNGDGVARNVSVEDEVPDGFVFGNGKGKRLAYQVGNLAPGASRNVTLTLRADTAGRYVNEVRAKMGKTIAATHKLGVEIVAPKLDIRIVGPTRRYIQREASYQLEVENSGSASAQNVLIVARLPRGMRFLSTNNRGQYNAREHSVYWSMVELAPQNKGTVELRLMPLGTGQQEIQFEARSLLDRTKLEKFPVLVDQLAELFFEVDDRDDPIEVNGETEYRVRVVNQGSKAATNVLLNIEMPTGIQAIKSDGPTKSQVKGQVIAFAPVASLAPRGELIYKVKAKGLRDGDHLIKVLLSSNERRESVAKQESTKVYSEYR